MGRVKPKKTKRQRTDYWKNNAELVTRTSLTKAEEKKAERESRKFVDEFFSGTRYKSGEGY